MSGARLFSRGMLWVWPIVGSLLLLVVGWFVNNLVERAVKATMAENLQTILNADVTALEIWLDQQQANAVAVAADDEVLRYVAELVALAAAEGTTNGDLLSSESLAQLRAELEPWIEPQGYFGFAVLSTEGQVIGAMRDTPIGITKTTLPPGMIERLFVAGRPMVTRPLASSIMLETDDGEVRAGVPTMFALTPVRDAEGQTIAALGLRIRPGAQFTEILGVARSGETGETYAFDAEGLLISQSRFDDDLKQIGLLTDNEHTRSILNIAIRDPQVDMTAGKRPSLRRPEQPLTRMAADAVEGNAGVDVDGYRDYRGVPVIGAWTWLDEYGFGVATEADVAEAYRPLYLLRSVFWSLFVLLVAAAAAIFVFTILVAKANIRARRMTIEAKQLGQYTLEEKIGAGGMGVVYRGHHAMLRRPTAIKLLDAERTNEQTIARFEREVQLTSQLNHPNTIAIYDYGRTPEGVFYYAMEFLDGIDLEELVRQDGPQRAGRVIHLMRQVCGSLGEAHSVGLIHRDIKPANVLLTQRGGIADFAKLLDFGLVKAVDGQREATVTVAGAMTGTPAYMSPEAVENPEVVDARSDLYAVGAMMYFLLTGRGVFEADNPLAVAMKHVSSEPTPPSAHVATAIDANLEALVMQCLAKDPADRPQTAGDLADALDRCEAAESWSQRDAQAWWQARQGPDTTVDYQPDSEANTFRMEETIATDQPKGE